MREQSESWWQVLHELGTSPSFAVATADIIAAVMMMAMEASIFCNSFDPVQERDVVYPDSTRRAYSCI
jgi:hypothetical protein